MSNPLCRVLKELETKMAQLAEDSMIVPKAEPFEHGMQVGIYAGLSAAKEFVQRVLSDDEDND